MKQAMANAETQGWAQTFAEAAGAAQKELDDAYSKDQFPNKLRAASLSPVLMKNLKKECGDSFLNKLVLLATEQEPIVKRMEEACSKFTVTQEALSRRTAAADPKAKKQKKDKKDKSNTTESATA